MISVVTAGRDDGYGGDFVGRVLTAYKENSKLQSRFGVNVEWIFVEWNPTSKDYMSYELASLGWTCYVVDPAIHDSVLHPDFPNFNNGFFLSYPKNIGIRRARGDWILSTNPDVIFGPDIWSGFNNDLTPGVLHRAVRVDVNIEDVDKLFSGDEYDVLNVHLAPGDFLLFSSDTRKGFDESINFACIHMDSRWMMDYSLRNSMGMKNMGNLYKLDHPMVWWRTQDRFEELTHTVKTWPYLNKTNSGDGLYDNPPNWGFADKRETKIASGVTYIHGE